MERYEILLEDWKMTHDRVKHFDSVILSLRLQGIPIAVGLITLCLVLEPFLTPIKLPLFSATAAIIPFFLILAYIFGLLTLDFVFFKLLLESITLAKEIEEEIEKEEKFKGSLTLATKLTKNYLTYLEVASAFLIYASFIVLIVLALSGIILQTTGGQPAVETTAFNCTAIIFKI